MAAAVDKDQRNDEWTMWFDGASNVVGNGIGVVLISPDNQCLPFAAKLGFDCTNNMAEYEACTMGLLMALEHQVKRRVFGDSALVIYQLRGEWEARDAKLIPYHDYAKEIMSAFDMITFNHVHREENQTADALATLSAMVQVNEGQEMVIQVRQQPQTAYCQCLSRETTIPNAEPWYFDIKRYLETGKYPDEASENSKRTLRRLASDDQEAKHIIEEVHEGIFGTHVSGHALARKILQAGYYWTRMESDCYQHVRKCAKCQIYANHLNVAPSTLHNLNAPWPFSMWGIDVIGPIEPKASNGHRFILVAIDYFTKWVEASSYSSVPRSTVVRVLAEAKLDETEWVQQRFDQLNLIEEKRLTALCHGQLYQKRVKRAFDKKVKPRIFQKGDMVLKKVLPNLKDPRGKWTPNYEGLYVMRSEYSTLEMLPECTVKVKTLARPPRLK
ncbi:Gypsy retrotransposon integrase-like protein 1, partial [Mucuna pruriens]